MNRDLLQPAYVLHRRDYGDTSLLLEIFTAGHGRLPVVAKGARRARRAGSSQAALLQPYQPLLLAWSGRGEVKTLTRAEPAGRAPMLVGDALYCGFYVNELLLRLLGRQDGDQVIFAAYQTVLAELAGGGDVETGLRRFELTLLGQLGYRPPLDRDADTGEPIRADLRYVCDPERGPVPAPPGEVPSAAAGVVSGATLLALQAGAELAAVQAREARDLMRLLLAPHLGERPLQSRALFAARRRAEVGAFGDRPL
ncbi:MAG: DNA repair protein RecO [Thiohalocapsa sp.]|uniref:DNA repair protein RecO n=1 Tax=Thiohalocapsa sp. TaxID=2497641 RepID=UPI0025D429C8|nr:DNA repair protein RecO [Thiohalocapsa sp.]MCG6939786.1 DNA repair protein RecO [Thiohalocapsa sp.]